MAASERKFLSPFSACLVVILCIVHASGQNRIPDHMKGDWYSYENGGGVETTLSSTGLDSKQSGVSQEKIFNGQLVGIIKMEDADSHELDYDIRAMFMDDRCYICYEFRYRTPNVLQYAKTTCQSRSTNQQQPNVQDVCDMGDSATQQHITMFRQSLKKVNCKTTFEGVYHFTYLSREGGGGVCDNSKSLIEACQEPGSQYVDNEVFTMGYRLCPGISSSLSDTIRFQCLGSWTDYRGNIWSAVSMTGTTVKEEMYRCLMTNEDQQRTDLKKRYVMSIKPECNSLKGIGNGPVELVLEPQMSEKQLTEIRPACNLPADFAGNWFTSGEYDSEVKINNTHIYFKTSIDSYHFRETYFTCQQNRESRYLMTAITRGRCEVDYICFDFMPRQYNVIRYRMAKPFRMSKRPDQDQDDKTLRDDKAAKFLEACSWSAFNFNQRGWKYYTFILDPPNPVPCPISGVYTFTQFGLESEKYKTRIRGITERPRMQIDCRKYESQMAVCSRDLKKMNIDTERCAYVDMIGRPIGEYDIADHELTCVGYWMEDFKSYLITYDEEDPNSRYRCWVYKRLDFKTIIMSKASRSSCNPQQSARSYTSDQGASLALELREFEREFDECPQWFSDGRLREGWRDETRMALLGATSTSPCLLLGVTIALVWALIRLR